MIGLDVGLIRKTKPGNWWQITPGFRERFGQAYDTEFARWIKAVKTAPAPATTSTDQVLGTGTPRPLSAPPV